MLNDLSLSIDGIVHGNRQQWETAETKIAGAMRHLSQMLAGLIKAGHDIAARGGTTFTGARFSFRGPDERPIYDADAGGFTARVFEARFGDVASPNVFGAHLEIDPLGQLSLHSTGGAHETSWYPGDTACTEIAQNFIYWLAEMKLCRFSPPNPNPLDRHDHGRPPEGLQPVGRPTGAHVPANATQPA